MSQVPEFPDIYLSAPHDCPYLSGEVSVSLLLDPNQPVSDQVFSSAVLMGFRRSGDLVYRPHCSNCKACVSVRTPVADFRPNRNQRRTMVKNLDVEVTFIQPEFKENHFELFCRYQAWKHTGDSMDHADRERYQTSMIDSNVNTALVEFTIEDQLIAVSVVDVIADGLSAVYTFFDPGQASRSLGTYAVLAMIEKARDTAMQYVYLGYWIKACQKMSYKQAFKPLQGYVDDEWVWL